MRLTFNEHQRKAAREYLAGLLEETDGNVSLAAQIAGRNRTTLYRLMAKFDVTITRTIPRRPGGHRGNEAWRELGR